MSSGPETAAQHTVPQRIDRIKAVPVRHPGRWIGVVVIAVIVALIGQSVATNENFRWDIVWLYLRDVKIIQGVGWTLLLTVASMVLAIVLAILLALHAAIGQSDFPLGQLVLGLVLPRHPGLHPVDLLGPFRGAVPENRDRHPLGAGAVQLQHPGLHHRVLAALLGLGLNESAYLAEIFRAGLKSVDKGQIEAAEALGIRKAKVMWRIVLPQAMRIIVPPTGNETIGMLKTTSLVLAVPFTLELTFASNALANKTYLPIPFLLIAAFWYLLITSILMVGQHYIERYYGKGVDNLSPAPLRAPEQNV